MIPTIWLMRLTDTDIDFKTSPVGKTSYSTSSVCEQGPLKYVYNLI